MLPRAVSPRISLVILGVVTGLSCQTATAEFDISGTWRPLVQEEVQERLGGPDRYDYSGIPLNQKGREAADAVDLEGAFYYDPELQCAPHGAAYMMRSPGFATFTYEDENTLHLSAGTMGDKRTIYFDDRSREAGPLTWSGHSLGRWEGDTLTVVTTHIRPRYLRRNGVQATESMVMTEHFMRTGDYLHVITIIDDPEYLTEPWVVSTSFTSNSDGGRGRGVRGGQGVDLGSTCEPIIWPGGAP